MSGPFDAAIHASWAAARALEPTEQEVERVLALDRRHAVRRPLRRRLMLLGLLVALVGGASAVPATRAAVRGVWETIAPWASGEDGRAPGRPVDSDAQVPRWLRGKPGETRVLAEVAGVRMVIVRDGDDELTVSLGESFAQSGPLEDWQELLAGHVIKLVGPASIAPDKPLDDRGRRPLFGFAAEHVARVEMTYEWGPPTVDRDVRGGFGLLMDLTRRQRALVAYDATGARVARTDLSGVEMRVCVDVRGCPPGARIPRLATRP